MHNGSETGKTAAGACLPTIIPLSLCNLHSLPFLLATLAFFAFRLPIAGKGHMFVCFLTSSISGPTRSLSRPCRQVPDDVYYRQANAATPDDFHSPHPDVHEQPSYDPRNAQVCARLKPSLCIVRLALCIRVSVIWYVAGSV